MNIFCIVKNQLALTSLVFWELYPNQKVQSKLKIRDELVIVM